MTGKSRKKRNIKEVWKSCMSGGKVRPLSSAPVRNINPAEDLGNDELGKNKNMIKSSCL